MRIRNNETHYDTRKLRSLICAVYNRMAKIEGKLPQWKKVYVDIVYSHGKYVSGYAYYRGREMRLRLPKAGVTPHTVAMLTEHEIYHLYGYRHKKMGNIKKDWRKIKGQYAWADEMLGETMPVKAEKAIPLPTTLDKQKDKYARLCAREESWQKKAKRAENALKKIRQRKKYYERVFSNDSGDLQKAAYKEKAPKTAELGTKSLARLLTF